TCSRRSLLPGTWSPKCIMTMRIAAMNRALSGHGSRGFRVVVVRARAVCARELMSRFSLSASGPRAGPYDSRKDQCAVLRDDEGCDDDDDPSGEVGVGP